jgi:hypothetical protein
VLTINTKTDISGRLECGENYKLKKEKHIKYNALISGKLLYPADAWSQRCQIPQILLYEVWCNTEGFYCGNLHREEIK